MSRDVAQIVSSFDSKDRDFTSSTTTGLVLFFLLLIGQGATRADEKKTGDDANGIAFFESKIRPVLVQHCYKCHSVGTGKSEGGLLLDSRKTIRAGGDRGPAVVPGDLKASLLLTAISHTDPDLKMPPKKERLPDTVISDIKAWIQAGAADPRKAEPTKGASPPVTLEAGRQFWAFQKPVPQKPPVTKNPSWAKRDLDHFILVKLDEGGMAPSADAEPAILLRRLHFDLVGLPPSPAAVREFLQRVEAGVLYDPAVAAPVVLQIINAPRSV